MLEENVNVNYYARFHCHSYHCRSLSTLVLVLVSLSKQSLLQRNSHYFKTPRKILTKSVEIEM